MALRTEFEIKEFNAAALTGNYQTMGSALSYACYEIIICNESDTAVYISIDGINTAFRVGAGTVVPVLSHCRYNTLLKGSFLFSRGTQFYIKHNIGAGTGYIVINALMVR